MSDLISRQAVMKLLTDVQINGGDLHDAKMSVEDLQTAFDVNKVAEQLEELSKINEEKSNICEEKEAMTEALIRCGVAKGYSYSAEIVKAGRIDE